MKLSSLPLLVALAGPLAGCVWSPNHQQTIDRTVPFDISGWSQFSGATITLQAFNYEVGNWTTVPGVQTTAAAGGLWSDPTLYSYELENVLLQSKYWIPPGAGCETGGMASLRVFENGYKMVAYDEAQRDCVWDQVWNDGEHPAHAGYDCGTSSQLVLFSPPTCP